MKTELVLKNKLKETRKKKKLTLADYMALKKKC